ncbi:hypothetical protein ACSBR2_021896 [Camellia fascicularis]
MTSSTGCITYYKPMPLWDMASGAHGDYSTHFSFIMNSQTRTMHVDVIAFFIAPVGFPIQDVQVGRPRLLSRKKKKRNGVEKKDDRYFNVLYEFEGETGPKKFSNKELAIATKNFVEEEKHGQGGIDSIYRGFLRDLNSYVAVKRVSRESTQGIKQLSRGTVVLTRRMGTVLLHRDIKLSNIMLDSNFNAKLENFGLANLVDDGKGS